VEWEEWAEWAEWEEWEACTDQFVCLSIFLNLINKSTATINLHQYVINLNV
jgi:hypothetical protein